MERVDPALVVLTAGTAPVGEPRDGEGRMAPVRFWQSVLCLGAAPRLRRSACADPARFDLLAHHPLSIGDPSLPSRGPLDAGIADLDRIGRLLRAAQRHGLVAPARGQGLAVTELNWDSAPDAPAGVPSRRLVRHVSAGLYLLWRQGVRVAFWQLLRDPPVELLKRLHPAGLYRIDRAHPLDPARDRPKAALRAFRMPFVALRLDAARVRVWGMLAAPGPRRAIMQRRTDGRWRRAGAVPVRRDGLVHAVVRLRGRARLRLAVPATGATSAAWPAGARPQLVPR